MVHVVTAHVNVLLCFTQHSKNHFVWTLTKSASYHCDDTFCNDFQWLFSTTFVCSTTPLVSSARTSRPSKVHDQSNVKLTTKVYREFNFCGDLENLCTSTKVSEQIQLQAKARVETQAKVKTQALMQAQTAPKQAETQGSGRKGRLITLINRVPATKTVCNIFCAY